MRETEHLLRAILDPETSIEKAVIVGQNMWRRGLLIQGHCRRIERELAELARRQKESSKIRVCKRSRK